MLESDARLLVVDFKKLDERDEVERAWCHLVPELPFNELRWSILRNLQVEQRLKNRITEASLWTR